MYYQNSVMFNCRPTSNYSRWIKYKKKKLREIILYIKVITI